MDLVDFIVLMFITISGICLISLVVLLFHIAW